MKHNTLLKVRLKEISPRKLFYISLLFWLFAIVTLGGAAWAQHNTQRPAPPIVGYAIGKKISSGMVTVQVISVETTDGIPFLMAPTGQHYVIPTIAIRNNLSHPINITPSTDIYVKNTAGVVSHLTPYSLKAPFRSGSLLPGDTIQGQLSFLANKTGNLRLYFDGIWSGGVLPFEVQP
ncbi:MAG: DUF4352 domain-containing protein [Candidatus Saccharibacteria bacterium]